jgi:CRISPR-associated endonuclease/helicase Cas3
MNLLEDFYKAASIQEIYEHQHNCWESIKNNENVILSIGTGGGKTESVLLPSIAKRKRVIFLYPTKALLEDQKSRIEKILKKLFHIDNNYRPYLTIDTGDEQDRTFYRADIILTTIDKFLYRVFGYGSARWGYIYPKRIVLNPLKPTILVFDEAHVYETIALTHFLFLMEKLTYENNIQTAILSATLPQSMIEMLTDTKLFPFSEDKSLFTLIPEQQDEVKRGCCNYVEHIQLNDVVSKVIGYFRDGKRVVTVFNRVYSDKKGEKPSVKALFDKLMSDLDDKEKEGLFVYHGHQFPTQRKKQLEGLFNNQNKPFILITTSAFEVGVDISSDMMFTEICMPDSFIQRIGRCARRKGEDGFIFTFGEPAWFFNKNEKELAKNLLDKLLENKGRKLNERLKAEINELNARDINHLKNYKNNIIYASDLALYQYVYDFVPEGLEVWRKGILATRDWLPSIYIQWGNNENNRLRLSANHFLDKNLIDDWWIEYRDDEHLTSQGRIRKSNNPMEIRLKSQDSKITLNAREHSLVIKSSRVIDNDFGLTGRITISPKKSWGGFGIQKNEATYKVPERNNINTISLIWYQPEDEDE